MHYSLRMDIHFVDVPSAPPVRKKHKRLSLDECAEVCVAYYQENLTQTQLAARFGVTQPTICRILKRALL